MKKEITRRDWLNRSSLLLGSSFLGASVGINTLKAAVNRPISNEPVRMMFNENPYGPSQVARRAMRKAFNESNLYSMRGAKAEFKELMAKLNGVTPDHIAVGFGSGEILKKAALMNGIDKGELLSPSLTFETINRYAKTMQSNVKRIPMTKNIGIDLDKMSEKISSKTKMVYLCNPNNPTGLLMDTNDLKLFCKQISQKAIVFVDEAYHEFSGAPSATSLVPSTHNLCVLRTFSKAWGLAGARLGYVIAAPEVIDQLKKIKSLLDINLLAIKAAILLIAKHDVVTSYISEVKMARTFLATELKSHGIQYISSFANFIHIRLPSQSDPTVIADLLEEKGYRIRTAGGTATILDGCIRITVGTRVQMFDFTKHLISALNYSSQSA